MVNPAGGGDVVPAGAGTWVHAVLALGPTKDFAALPPNKNR